MSNFQVLFRSSDQEVFVAEEVEAHAISCEEDGILRLFDESGKAVALFSEFVYAIKR